MGLPPSFGSCPEALDSNSIGYESFVAWHATVWFFVVISNVCKSIHIVCARCDQCDIWVFIIV